jgi:RNA polymerase sigma factor (TIGR02999 family)
MSEPTADGEGAASYLELADCGAPPELRRTAAELLPTFYRQVKQVARRERGRYGAVTLQTTELVHEAYLRLRGSGGFADEAHFLRAAALAMRHALINHAAERLAAKRGGGAPHVTLSHADDLAMETDESLVSLNEALQRLAHATPRLAEVVQCRFFAGYDEENTALALGVSLRTVQRDWLKARAWLFRELFRAA